MRNIFLVLTIAMAASTIVSSVQMLGQVNGDGEDFLRALFWGPGTPDQLLTQRGRKLKRRGWVFGALTLVAFAFWYGSA